MTETNEEKLENLSPIGYDKDGNILLKGEDYHFLLEQAESAQMWRERYADHMGVKEDKIEDLDNENARLRKALQYYAETDYEVHVGYDDSIDLPEICFEKGEKARQALNK
jgi:hypothetical protein